MLTETREWRCASSAHDVWRAVEAYGSSGIAAPAGRRGAFWCIEARDEGRSLLLRAGNLRQGRLWLELSVAGSAHESVCRQRVIFLPCGGPAARLHWARLLPFRRSVRRGIGERLCRTRIHGVLHERLS